MSDYVNPNVSFLPVDDSFLPTANFFEHSKYLCFGNPEKPNEGGISSTLDNVLVERSFLEGEKKDIAEFVIQLVSFYDPSVVLCTRTVSPTADLLINPRRMREFIDTYLSNVNQKVHESTDHLIPILYIRFKDGKEFRIAYVSFENSVRSSGAGVDIEKRIPGFCDLFKKLAQMGCYIFLSEAGRDVFGENVRWENGVLQTDVKIKWEDVVKTIRDETGYSLKTISYNNDEIKFVRGNPSAPAVLSFAVALFSPPSEDNQEDVSFKNVRFRPAGSNGCGFVQLTIRKVNILGVHFPLNFQKGEEDNPFTLLSKELAEWCRENDIDVLVGDFNTILAGFDRYNVLSRIFRGMYALMIPSTFPTFWPSFCDRAPVAEDVDGKTVKAFRLDLVVFF